MATSKDMRDIMGLGAAGPKPMVKEQRPAQPRPRLTGISREVQALMGERGVPPVVLTDSTKTYKPNRIRSDLVVRKWKLKPFLNPAREDGLVLRHWRRTNDKATPKSTTDSDATKESENPDQDEMETTYDFAKYNIDISGASYEDAQYEVHFADEDWTREETDYLVDLVKEYYHRWPLVADRYDYRPPDTTSGEEPPTALVKPRSMEDLKKRYYTVWAKSMELSTVGGLPNMNETEFALHESLRTFNPKIAADRKRVADALLTRNADEVKEEEQLLAELQRIVANAQRFDAERSELRARLEYPHSAASPAQYQTSQGLSALFSALIQTERMRKRLPGPTGVPARLSLGGAPDALGASPSTAAAGGNAATPVASTPRESLGGQQKKGGAAASASQTPVRTISPRQEARYGITTHDRLASGVTFRSDKVIKMRQAKSGVQTQKIAAALAELGIPDLVQLPTARVCEAFEKVVAGIGKLLEARKVAEREEGDIKVAETVRAERLGLNTQETSAEGQPAEGVAKLKQEEGAENVGKPADGGGDADLKTTGDGEGKAEASGEAPNVIGEDGDATELPSREEGDDEKARPLSSGSLSAVTRAGHKRSASVMSQASRGSRGSVKKARK